MRILHILDHSVPLHSGYTFRTAAILREQRKLGWETFHLTSPKQGKTSSPVEHVGDLTFHRSAAVTPGLPVLSEIRLMAELERRLVELVEEIRPDILHAHSPVLNVLPALRVGKRLNIPTAYEIRAFWEDAAVDHGTTRENSLRYRLTRMIETHAIRRAQHVFTICEGLRRDIVSRGIAESHVTVIPNAVDIGSFQLSGQPDRDLQGRMGLLGKQVVGFVGSFYAYEGLDILLDALPLLLKEHPDMRILLVGGGPQEANLRQQAHQLGIEDKVIFVGRVNHDEVNRYYDLVDVLAYPRHSMRLTELVTPLKPLEAMAQGKIFVASDVGGHRELIRDGETGILFKPDDARALANAIHDLIARQDRWPVLRAAGRRFVETERNWKVSVSNYAPIYEKLVRHGGARGIS